MLIKMMRVCANMEVESNSGSGSSSSEDAGDELPAAAAVAPSFLAMYDGAEAPTGTALAVGELGSTANGTAAAGPDASLVTSTTSSTPLVVAL